MSTASPGQPPFCAIGAFVVALAAVVLVAAAGPAYRVKAVELPVAFGALRWGAWLGLGAALAALIGAWLARPAAGRRGFVLALVAFILGLGVFGAMYAMQNDARKAPPIHDVTTDVANPPAFVAIVPLRRTAANPVQYGGPDIARQQQAAFPDIQPLMVAMAPAAAFARALAVARDMGWEIVAEVPEEGRIEATATTAWFGFKDDVVVRIAAAEGGSRVDVRSLSRIGHGDLGKNAARVRAYLKALAG